MCREKRGRPPPPLGPAADIPRHQVDYRFTQCWFIAGPVS